MSALFHLRLQDVGNALGDCERGRDFEDGATAPMLTRAVNVEHGDSHYERYSVFDSWTENGFAYIAVQK
ncbi:hypothetical protein FHX77_000601 [Bifidobacterium commune]|nr:hypothetical protein [Bifidobacterium commune]